VEQFITYPIELEFNGMPKVREIRSISRTGVSAVTVIFEDGTDIYFARQLVNERLKMAEEIIPKGYGKPELSPIATGLGDIYEFTLSSEKHTKEELKTYMKWEIARQIRSVKGIIDVNIYGGDEKQYQIKIDPRRLQALNLTLSTIAESLESANMNVGGGYISKGEEQIVKGYVSTVGNEKALYFKYSSKETEPMIQTSKAVVLTDDLAKGIQQISDYFKIWKSIFKWLR
jgi:cobalt-zinc-cadmium resistance protein CzcA